MQTPMNNELLSQARRLAMRAYSVEVSQDIATDGEPIFVALTPEMPGCIAQGETADEAKANLHDALVDFIYFLLEDGLPVPEPATSPA